MFNSFSAYFNLNKLENTYSVNSIENLYDF